MRKENGYSTRTYNRDFYQKLNIDRGAIGGAKQIVPIVLKILRDNGITNPSVVDIGCGTGIWLNEFKKNKCRIHGYDGSNYSSFYLISESEFEKVDLIKNNIAKEKYDLAVSLEVAEHIPEKYSENYMSFLTSTSDIILFSAAIPGQGGQGHVNEQWQSYWVERFKNYGYECIDIIRDQIWNDSDIWFYYKQNILLFIKKSAGYDDYIKNHHKKVLDRVHPNAWKKVNDWIPTKIVLAAYNNRTIYNIYQKFKNYVLRARGNSI